MTGTTRRGARVLEVVTVVNVVFILLLYLAENYIGERHWLATLAMLSPQHPFGAPTLILFLWSLMARHRRMLALNVVAALFFAIAILGFSVPWRLVFRPDGTRVRVMTYNIHHAMAGVDGVVAAIKAQSPDIVLMQEANAWRQYPDPLRPIARRFPEWHTARADDVAVLSRFPITGSTFRPLAPGTDRVALSCTVSVKGKRLAVVNTHLNAVRGKDSIRHPKPSLADYMRRCAIIRREQSATVRAMADRAAGPVLIAGDFNTPPQGITYRFVTGRYRDAFACAGWGLGCTYRSNLPVLRIDYIFVGDGIGVRRCWAPDTRASDHRPVVTELALRE